MTRFILRWLVNGLAVWAALSLLDLGSQNWTEIIALGLILTLVNIFVRPLAKVVGCLPNLLTLGLFSLVINAFLFWLTGVIGQMFGMGFDVEFWPAVLGGLIVSVVSMVMGIILKDELKGKKK